MKDTIYVIKLPYTSPALKVNYHKKIEIFVYKLTDINSYYCSSKFVLRKNKLVKTKSNSEPSLYYNKIKILSDIIDVNNINASLICFDSLDFAFISKILLINKMEDLVKDQIKILIKKLEKGLPDKNILNEMKDKYPELFI